MSAKKKTTTEKPLLVKKGGGALFGRIVSILEDARSHVARTVNSAQVAANWLIGREIVEEEQRGEKRAGYGEELIESLGKALTREYGRGFSATNLRLMRHFYLIYPSLLGQPSIQQSLPAEFGSALGEDTIQQAPPAESQAGRKLHPNLSWTHYTLLLKVQKPLAREFYEGECLEARSIAIVHQRGPEIRI